MRIQISQNLILTYYAVAVAHVFDPHFDIPHAEVHLQLLQSKVTTTFDQKRLSSDEDFGLDTVCEGKRFRWKSLDEQYCVQKKKKNRNKFA